MTKEQLEEKFEDCFDANTRSTEGGYGPDTTGKHGLWVSFQPIVELYAKQQAIAFAEYASNNEYVLCNIPDGWIKEAGNGTPLTSQQLYNQFIQSQNESK